MHGQRSAGGGLRVSSAAERRGTAVRGVGGLISSLGGLSPLCGGCLLCRGPLEATGASPHLPVGFGVPHVWMQLGAGGCSNQIPNPAAHPGGCRVREAGGDPGLSPSPALGLLWCYHFVAGDVAVPSLRVTFAFILRSPSDPQPGCCSLEPRSTWGGGCCGGCSAAHVWPR